MALLQALLWPILRGWLPPTQQPNGPPVVQPSFFVERDIAEWPRDVLVKGDDLLLLVGKRDDHETLPWLEVEITLQSSGYTRFLYDNQRHWLSGEIELPGISTLEVKSKTGASTLAVATELVALDVAAMERENPETLYISEPYRPPEKLRPAPANCPSPERFQGFLKALAEAIGDPELTLSAFRRGGMVEENLYVDDALPVIYLALRTGREPGAVVECLSGFDISGARDGLEEIAWRAYERMHDASAEPPAAGRMHLHLAALRAEWSKKIRPANPVAVAVAVTMAIAGCLDWSWGWVVVGVGVLSIASWPDWRKALASAHDVDKAIEPSAPLRELIVLIIGLEILGKVALCVLAFALGWGAAWWWST